jgi:hypothetical protein
MNATVLVVRTTKPRYQQILVHASRTAARIEWIEESLLRHTMENRVAGSQRETDLQAY